MSESDLITTLYQLAETSPVESFQQCAYKELNQLIQFDFAGWGESAVLSDSMHILRAKLFNLPDEFNEDYNKVRHHSPMASAASQSNGTTLVGDLTDHSIELEPSFRAYIDKYDVPRMMITNEVHESGLFMVTIAIWRKGCNRGFSESERKLKEQITPHLIESFKHCRRFDIQRKLLKQWEMRRGFATCNEHGIFFDADDFLINLLKQDWPDWQGAQLPSELHQALKFENIIKTTKNFYRWVLLDDLYLLVGARLDHLEQLSKREFQIAYIYSNGSTSKEIATKLSISPITVKNHIANIYEKLKLDSKYKLKQLFVSNE